MSDQSESQKARASGIRTIQKVLPYLWPEDKLWVKIRVVLSMIVLVLGMVATAITPYFFRDAVDVLAPENADRAQTFMTGAVGLTIAYGVMRALGVGFNQLRDVIFAKVAQRALRQLALETFRHIHALSLRYHITRKTGGLSRIIERGVKGVEFLLRFMLFSVGPLFLQLIFVSGILLYEFGFWYLVIVLSTIGIYIWFTFALTEWRVKIRKQMNDSDTNANQKAIDSLLNFETVKYFNAEEREAQRYDVSMRGYEEAALKTAYSLSALNFGQAVIITIGLVGVMVLAAIGVQNGILSVGEFVMVNAYMIQLTMPLNFLGTVYREIRQALVDMGEMFDLLEQPAEISDKADAKPLVVKGGKLEFRNMTFNYEENRTILEDFDLTVNAGETVAVVGPSGSGKSTIGRILFRFYDVAKGGLFIDGQDVRDVTQVSLRSNIGVVPQDTVLFNDTIGYNVGYGRPGATQEDIENAAKAAQIHDFVMSLPEGYETTVGERGLKLSGGEKQRVGIARTLLKNPPILLLDEATSALDTNTEREIQDSLKAMGQGRTVITIAHRLSTVVDSDLIVVLADGKIAERGTHDELLQLDGRYAHLWHTQSAGEDEKHPA